MDWKSKLTSRKLWMAVANFVTMMMIVAFGKTESEAGQVAALIMAGAGVIAYIVGEGLIDAADAKTDVLIPDEPQYDSEEDTESSEEDDLV